MDRLLQLNQVAGGVAIPGLGLGYQPDPIGLTLGDGVKSYSYDPLNRVQTAQTADNRTYAYDQADRLSQVQVQAGATTNYGYDGADQLCYTAPPGAGSCASPPTGASSYLYDPDGNRTRRTDAGGSTLSYAWDQAHRLASYQDSQIPAHSSAYLYNGDGLRLQKRVNGVATNQAWDLAEGLPLLLQETTGGQTSYYITGLGGLPLEEIAPDGTAYYFHADKLGSTRALSKDDGTANNTYDYDAYGNLTTQTGFLQLFQYTGQYTDAESGLQYLRARYYDTSTQQFLNRDPVTEVTGMPYVYVGDNSPNIVDPAGLFGIGGLAIAGGGVWGGAGAGAGLCIFGGCEAAAAAAAAALPWIIAAAGAAVLGYEIGTAGNQLLEASDPYLVAGASWAGSAYRTVSPQIGSACDSLVSFAKPSKKSDAERATDAPSWAKALPTDPNESCAAWAKRLLDAKYGEGNYKTGGGSEYSQMKKWCERR